MDDEYFNKIFPDTLTFLIQGDTIVNGINCSKSYLSMNGKTEYFAALFEEGHKVYYIGKSTTSPSLLYDFDISTGDSVYIHGAHDDFYYIYYLDSDTIEMGNDSLVRYYFYQKADILYNLERAFFFHTYWIEGIGALTWPFVEPFNANAITNFISCSTDGEIVFEQKNFFQESTKILNIRRNQDKRKSINYLISGQKAMNLNKNAIYIRDGKKYIAR